MSLAAIESLRCFVTAAETLSFRETAKLLHVTPAAVGQRIKLLEEQFDVILFARTTRRMTITEAGRSLLPLAEATLESSQRFASAARGGSSRSRTRLTIGTRHELGLSWLLPARSQLLDRLPGLSIDLYFGSGVDLERRVLSGEIECAVTSARIGHPRITYAALHEETYVFVAAPKLLTSARLRNQSDCRHHTLIDTDRSLPLYRYFRDGARGFAVSAFRDAIYAGTISAIRAMVIDAEGVAVLPTYFVNEDIKQGSLKRILSRRPLLADEFRLIFRDDSPHQELLSQIGMHLRTWPLR